MMKKILIAIDDSSSAINAAQYAIQFAKELGAEVGIVYVTLYSVGAIDAGITPAELEKKRQISHHALMNEIDTIYPDLSLKKFAPIGKPESEIQHLVELWKPDLLVIGHHEHHFFQRLFQLGTEIKLLDHLSVPLLVVPQGASFH